MSAVNLIGITIGVHTPHWNCDYKHVRFVTKVQTLSFYRTTQKDPILTPELSFKRATQNWPLPRDNSGVCLTPARLYMVKNPDRFLQSNIQEIALWKMVVNESAW